MTSVTKDVVSDLLPVYLAGEASSDTRSLVEEFLARDRELRDQVAAHRESPLPPLVRPEGLDSLEMTALDRTRRLLSRKAWLLAFSLFFSLIPMSFEFNHGKLVYLLARDAPVTAIAWLVVALVGWIAYLDTCGQLSPTGLQPSHNWSTQFRWALIGAVLGSSVMLALGNWLDNAVWLRAIPLVSMFLALRLGERWRHPERRAR